MAQRAWFTPGLIGVFGLLCGAYAWLLGARVASGEHDFLSFYTGAKLALSGSLYDLAAQFRIHRETVGHESGGIPFIRLPYYAALLQPLAWMPFHWAWAAWAAVQGLCALWIFWLFGRTDREYLCIMMLLPAVYISIMGGQDTLIFTAMIIGVWMLLERRQDAPAGALLALALVKPHFALVFALVLVIRRRWRALAGFAATAAVLYLVSASISGLDWPVRWMHVVRPEVLAPKRHVMPNALNLLETIGTGSRLPWLASVAILCGWLTWAAHRSPTLEKAFACTSITAILIAPHAYLQDLVLLLPTFAWLGMPARWQLPRLTLIPVVLFLPFLIPMGRPFSSWTPVGLLAVLIVISLTALRRSLPDGENARAPALTPAEITRPST